MEENNNPYYSEENNNPYYSEEPDRNYNTVNQNPYSDNGSGNYYNTVNYGMPAPQPPKKGIGFAVASMVLGIISVVMCCSIFIRTILSIAALVFGIIALVSKQRGTGMSITGIITSSVSIIMSIILLVAFGKVAPEFGSFIMDLCKAAVDQETVVEEYERTGELPDYLQKYDEGEWGEFFDSLYDGGFKEYFEEVFIDSNNHSNNYQRDFDDFEYEHEYNFDDFKNRFNDEYGELY